MRGKVSEGYVKVGFRVPTTSVEVRSKRSNLGQGTRVSKQYVILGFRVSTTCVGERQGVRGARGMLH